MPHEGTDASNAASAEPARARGATPPPRGGVGYPKNVARSTSLGMQRHTHTHHPGVTSAASLRPWPSYTPQPQRRSRWNPKPAHSRNRSCNPGTLKGALPASTASSFGGLFNLQVASKRCRRVVTVCAKLRSTRWRGASAPVAGCGVGGPTRALVPATVRDPSCCGRSSAHDAAHKMHGRGG